MKTKRINWHDVEMNLFIYTCLLVPVAAMLALLIAVKH